jgi:hypothetical protein
MARERPAPRTFYLNEQHELARGEKPGGGRTPHFLGIDWAMKGHALGESLTRTREVYASSRDPLADRHYFALAKPVERVRKPSTDRRRAQDGEVEETFAFAGNDSRAFRRLGMDLIHVADTGEAVVHMPTERLDQLVSTTRLLGDAGLREQARWAAIDAFDVIPPSFRVDDTWLRSLRLQEPTEAVVEFQPLLSRLDVETLLQAIAAVLKRERAEAITGIGIDFSGRQWVRGKLTPTSVRAIAKAFYSVQSLHSPLVSFVSATKSTARHRPIAVATRQPRERSHSDPASLPTVAVLDTGIPTQHAVLAPFRRGSYTAPDSRGVASGDHGSFVASRVVFGDPDFGHETPNTPNGTCRFFDVLVGLTDHTIDEKSVVPAMSAVVGTAPDVRVFNLSFDTPPLDRLLSTNRRESLLLVQDLDNFVFQNDVLVVVAAGNSPPGVMPTQPYPMHLNESEWQLGAWARTFNGLTCGSVVERLSPDGLVTTVGWPSPFSRMGPGLCATDKPDYAAHGGNSTATMQQAPGLGVWGLTSSGMWEDRSATSFAAPLLAREAALAIDTLQRVCQQGARPFAVTAKAFLALTAIPHSVGGAAAELAKRTLGRGRANCERLRHPSDYTGVLVWQGVLQGPDDVARIMIPVPQSWYDASSDPCLRLVVSWDPPVNAAAHELWATRKLTAHLKPGADGSSLRGAGAGHESYPIIDRTYHLRKLPRGSAVEGDTWLLELTYHQIADYYVGITFSPEQRVAFAAELLDDSSEPQSPQAALQALPNSVTMTRLSIPPQAVRTAVIVRTTE